MNIRAHLSVAAGLLIGVVTATAQLPRTISFQGILSGTVSDKPLSGQHTLRISIYDAPSSGAALFDETHTVDLANGVFNVVIGSQRALPVELAFDKAYWLGVGVDGQPELEPRMPFTAVPYALAAVRADRAEGAAWSTLSDTASHLRGGAVRSINAVQGAVTIVGAGSTQVTSANDTITINGMAGGIATVQNTDTSMAIDADGPTVTLNIRDGGIRRDHLRDLAVNVEKISTGAPAAESGKALMSTGIEIPMWGYPTASDLILPFYRAMTMNDIPFTLQNMGSGTTALFSSHDATTYNPALDVFTWGRGTAARFVARSTTRGASSAIAVYNASSASTDFGVLAAAAAGTAVVGTSPYVGILGTLGDARYIAPHAAVVGSSRFGQGVVALSEETNALGAINNGSQGSAGSFRVDGSENSSPAIVARTLGSGPAIHAASEPVGAFDGTRAGVLGESRRGPGIVGVSSDLEGVVGLSVGGGDESYGVVGLRLEDDGFGFGALGSPDAAVYAVSSSGSEERRASLAGLFVGDVVVEGNLQISGSISTPGSIVRIDHPLDPANRYLDHAFVESSEMLNVYSGTAVLDAGGRAVVQLPEWFEAATSDHRYQLTCIGGYAPVYVGSEVRDNAFTIAGGTPGLKVCWQITGVRNDPQSRAHRFATDVDKATVAGAHVGSVVDPRVRLVPIATPSTAVASTPAMLERFVAPASVAPDSK